MDVEITISGGMPQRVAPGEYEAVVETITVSEQFGRPQLAIRFRLVGMNRYAGTKLFGFAALKKDGTGARRSKVTRWYQIVVGFSGHRTKRISLPAFKQYVFRVRVDTVDKDYRRRALPTDQCYEVVTEILEVIGRLNTAEVQSNIPTQRNPTRPIPPLGSGSG